MMQNQAKNNREYHKFTCKCGESVERMRLATRENVKCFVCRKEDKRKKAKQFADKRKKK